jgi:galactokinase
MTLLSNVKSAFIHHFKIPPTAFFRAPGRVNLIGEHTDYNDGFVLPCAIDFETIVVARKRDDGLVNVQALDYEQKDSFDLNLPIEKHESYQWANYVRGVAKSLQEKGLILIGCDIAIGGNVPQGAGLSSSASLEVVLGLTYSSLANEPLSSKENALNGQHAENNFVGCNCGIMDQLISAQGEKNKALLIDCRSLESKAVHIPQNLSVMIINSNVKRGLVDSEYNTRRQQCEQAAKTLGIKALRDITWSELIEKEQHLLVHTNVDVVKRAKHIVSENERTVLAAQALADNNVTTLSRLMAQSHSSMKNDFEITVPAIDYLVEIIATQLGEQGGVRMTGGGFGGCVVALMPNELVDKITQMINENYTNKTSLVADIFVCKASQGAEVMNGFSN